MYDIVVIIHHQQNPSKSKKSNYIFSFSLHVLHNYGCIQLYSFNLQVCVARATGSALPWLCHC